MLAPSNHDTSTFTYNLKRKSFTILPAVSSRHESANGDPRTNLTSIPKAKVRSAYHQNCLVPNENFSIEHHSIGSKIAPVLQQPTANPSAVKNLYATSNEFFARVSSKLKTLRTKVNAIAIGESSPRQPPDTTKMEKPKFVTTVKSGAFLEPPPELAALLGLRKNSFTNLAHNGTGHGTNHNRANMMYSFSSKPRLVKSNFQMNTSSRNALSRWETSREKRDAEKDDGGRLSNEPSDGSIHYGNTMFDRRVARGSNFASLRPNIAPTDQVLNRQAEARRRAAVRQRAQIRARRLRMRTPPPVDGRKHEEMQTDKYLEELTERPHDRSVACQADLPIDTESIYEGGATNGVDAETQIDTGDLPPENDDETHPVVSSIVKKILEEAILEINEEIEKFRNSSTEKVTNKDTGNTLRNGNAVIITKSELSSLICDIAPKLINVTSSAINTDAETVKSDTFLEKILNRIRTLVKHEKFLTDLIKNQLEEWSAENRKKENLETVNYVGKQYDNNFDSRARTESKSESPDESVNADLTMTNQNQSNYENDESGEIGTRNERTASEQTRETEPETSINDGLKIENQTQETKPTENADTTQNSINLGQKNSISDAKAATKAVINEFETKTSSKNTKEISDSNHEGQNENETKELPFKRSMTEKSDEEFGNEAKTENDGLKEQIQKETEIIESESAVHQVTDEKPRDHFKTNDSVKEGTRMGDETAGGGHDLEKNDYENSAKLSIEKLDSKNEVIEKHSIASDDPQIDEKNVISIKNENNKDPAVSPSDNRENEKHADFTDKKLEKNTEDDAREKSSAIADESLEVQENKTPTEEEKSVPFIENRDEDEMTVISTGPSINSNGNQIDEAEHETLSKDEPKSGVNVPLDKHSDVGNESHTRVSEITDTKFKTSTQSSSQRESPVEHTKNGVKSENTKEISVESMLDPESKKSDKIEDIVEQKTSEASEQNTMTTETVSAPAANKRISENEVAGIEDVAEQKSGEANGQNTTMTETVSVPTPNERMLENEDRNSGKKLTTKIIITTSTDEKTVSKEILIKENSISDLKAQTSTTNGVSNENKNEKGSETSTHVKGSEKSEDTNSSFVSGAEAGDGTNGGRTANMQEGTDDIRVEEKFKVENNRNGSRETSTSNQDIGGSEINLDKSKINVNGEGGAAKREKNRYDDNYETVNQKLETDINKGNNGINSIRDVENSSNKADNEFAIAENQKEHAVSRNLNEPQLATTTLSEKS